MGGFCEPYHDVFGRKEDRREFHIGDHRLRQRNGMMPGLAGHAAVGFDRLGSGAVVTKSCFRPAQMKSSDRKQEHQNEFCVSLH